MKVSEILNESMSKPTFTGKYPIAMGALSALPSESGTIKRFDKAVPVIQACLDAGEIINTQYSEVKDALSRFVDEAFKSVINAKYFNGGQYRNQPEELHYLSMPSSPREINFLVKKLKALAKNDALAKTSCYKDMVALCDELGNLTEVDAWLKEHTVKASVKKAEAKEAAKNEYDKKYTNHDDVKKVVDKLKETASSIEEDLFKGQLKSLMYVSEQYQKKCKEDGITDYMVMYEKNPYSKMIIQGIVERVYPKNNIVTRDMPKEFKLIKDWKEKLESTAKKSAADIVDHFVYKNSGKLSFVLVNKNNLKSVTITNVNLGKGVVECDVTCKFDDGSEFLAQSSVVYAVSKLGKWFYRYPTLFKNVKLPDGSMLRGATEQKMDEIFAITK
jgi:hypothetical protein